MKFRLYVIWRAVVWLMCLCLIPGYHRAIRTYWECFPEPLPTPPEREL